MDFRIYASLRFEKDIKKLKKNNPKALKDRGHILNILKIDPFNISKQYDIKKLSGIKHGEGQYRIRTGDFRIRYDVSGDNVVLYSFRDRKEAY